MSNRHKKKFTIKHGGRKGKFTRIAILEYKNCEFSAGIVEGLDPDDIYLRFDRDNGKPITLFLRDDEAYAIIAALSQTLWARRWLAMEAKDEQPEQA